MDKDNLRFISPEKGTQLFLLQAQLFPEILEEVHRLSGGSVGLIGAIMVKMGEAISEDPVQETTVARIHEALGVNEDEVSLPEWQSTFWDAFKSEQENRNRS